MEQSRAAAPTLDWVAVPSHVAEGPAEVRHKDGWLVCLVPADSYAKLIAAAPELLEALTGVADTLRKIDAGDPTSETGWDDPRLFDLWKRVTDVLAKAAS